MTELQSHSPDGDSIAFAVQSHVFVLLVAHRAIPVGVTTRAVFDGGSGGLTPARGS